MKDSCCCLHWPSRINLYRPHFLLPVCPYSFSLPVSFQCLFFFFIPFLSSVLFFLQSIIHSLYLFSVLFSYIFCKEFYFFFCVFSCLLSLVIFLYFLVVLSCVLPSRFMLLLCFLLSQSRIIIFVFFSHSVIHLAFVQNSVLYRVHSSSSLSI
jgi:hypothetical protein